MTESSFLKKLKKGMGVDESSKEIKEEIEEKESEPEKEKKSKKTPKIEMKTQTLDKEPAEKEEKVEEKEAPEEKKSWLEPEGQLAVDIYQTEDELVIQSAVAGVRPEDLDVSIEGDVITIRGKRGRPVEEKGDYFTQECYWGPFSREIILPVEIDPGRVEAIMKEGILTIRIPKIIRERKRKITIQRSA